MQRCVPFAGAAQGSKLSYLYAAKPSQILFRISGPYGVPALRIPRMLWILEYMYRYKHVLGYIESNLTNFEQRPHTVCAVPLGTWDGILVHLDNARYATLLRPAMQTPTD